MGQQQLLLLVLATVIVGLATVAGIQAFDEGQSQASQDALTQRATTIASDIKAAESKPDQLGGLTIGTEEDSEGNDQPTSTATEIANTIGLSGVEVTADGAGADATCLVATASSGAQATVACGSSDAQQDVKATFDPSASTGDQISTEFGDFTTTESSDESSE